ncbi:MAG: hypothetical protein WA144_15515 [Candidatus Methanoperedens sp.]
MAKLGDVLEGKGGKGEWFTPDDIEKQTVTITEALTMDSEIREHKTGKKFKNDKTGKEQEQMYYCVEITDGKETKDLHLTWVGLTKYLAPILPKNESWKGYQFVIDAVKKNGKLDIRAVGKVTVEQMQLNDTKKPEGETSSSKIQRILTILISPGVHDSKIGDKFIEVFGTKEAGEFAFGMLKSEGKIIQKPDNCWVKV